MLLETRYYESLTLVGLPTQSRTSMPFQGEHVLRKRTMRRVGLLVTPTTTYLATHEAARPMSKCTPGIYDILAAAVNRFVARSLIASVAPSFLPLRGTFSSLTMKAAVSRFVGYHSLYEWVPYQMLM
jgi:hypothetical protein